LCTNRYFSPIQNFYSDACNQGRRPLRDFSKKISVGLDGEVERDRPGLHVDPVPPAILDVVQAPFARPIKEYLVARTRKRETAGGGIGNRVHAEIWFHDQPK
jgi:hypothetical protein